VIVVSHRGPVSFSSGPAGTFPARRGAGGVVSALAPLLRGRDGARWVAAAIGHDDRAAVKAGAATMADFELDLLVLDEETHRLHYDVMSNQILWFCFHGLFDTTLRPPDPATLTTAWAAYREVNRRFAEAVAETAPAGDTVLVQDLHFLLVGRMLHELRPDLAVAHFTHTPFATPSEIDALTRPIADELLGALGAVPAGFHSPRWVESFRACCVRHQVTPADAFAVTFAPALDDLLAIAHGDETRVARERIRAHVGDRRVVARVDRVELSKNIVRGFEAFALLLRTRPEWRDRVTFVAMLNPSRESLPEYQAYRARIDSLVTAVNEEFGDGRWTPIVAESRDDFPRSIAALQLADVLLVNPVRDGLNLVAMEGPLVNERDAALVLSHEAGAYDLVQDDCIGIDPFDIPATATALHEALVLDAETRARRQRGLQHVVRDHPADRWLDELVRRARPAP
jgi:trehalose 6-phosphate synthase